MNKKFRVFRKIDKGKVNFRAKTNKRHRVSREFGKVLINLGYLTFTSLVLGNIIKGDYDRLTLLWIGGGIASLLILFGIILLSTGEEKWNH